MDERAAMQAGERYRQDGRAATAPAGRAHAGRPPLSVAAAPGHLGCAPAAAVAQANWAGLEVHNTWQVFLPGRCRLPGEACRDVNVCGLYQADRLLLSWDT